MRQVGHKVSRRQVLQLAAAVTATVPLRFAQAADQWKASKPIRLIVPFTPGGASDILARMVANAVGDKLGQPIVVDNKPGASGSIGSQLTSMAASDGTTLVVATTDSHSIYPHVYAKPIFAAAEQVPVAPLAIIPFCLLARADLPANSLKEFVELAKKQQISYASWGYASAPHAASIILGKAAGISNMLHVPYVGTAPAIQAVMAGQVDVVMGPVAMALANKGKLKAIAVMAPERVELMPALPTFAEQGLPLRKEGEFWVGIFATPKTPPHIINALSQAFTIAVAQPDYKNKVVQLGMVPQSEAASQYAKFYKDDYERWGRLIREAGIRQE